MGNGATTGAAYNAKPNTATEAKLITVQDATKVSNEIKVITVQGAPASLLPKMDSANDLTAEPQFAGEQVATFGEESLVCRTRRGSALRYQTILKCDHFPSAQDHKLSEKLDGAANFRQVEGCNVFGVGQPGVAGFATVLKRVLQTQGVEKVEWFNMREEPVIYINGKPYCVKIRTSPFNNQELTGIDTTIVEQIDANLKNEILAEAKRFDGKILLHGETKPPEGSELAAWGKAYSYWETVTEDSVMTVREVANKLIADGFPLTYHRIPITDEKTPQLKDFDQVLSCFSTVDPSSVGLVFNCQLGRGRTTTGMSLAVMTQAWMGKTPMLTREPSPDKSFAAVEILLSFFPGATQAKADVDTALGQCAHIQHLRDAITTKRGTKYAAVGLCYLERYIFIILFMAFMREQAAGPDGHPCDQTCAAGGFEQWVTNHEYRSQIYNLVDHMDLGAP